MRLRRYFVRNSLFAVAGLGCLLLGVFAYATIDRTIPVSEDILIIPGQVQSESWLFVEQALLNEVPQQALYQSFSKANSAYIDASILSPETEILDDSTSPPVAPTETAISEEDASSAVSDGGTSDEPTAVPETSPVPSPVDTETTTDEPVIDAGSQESGVAPEPVSLRWGLPTLARKLFPLAQAESEMAISTTAVSQSDLLIEAVEAVVAPEPIITEEQYPTTENIATPAGPEEESLSQPTDAPVTEPDMENPEGEVYGELELDATAEAGSEAVVEPYVNKYRIECEQLSRCDSYNLNFSGFFVPDFKPGAFLSSMQLRVSLAARTRSEVDSIQRLLVEYTYSTDEEWRVATMIEIDEEVSNSINGGPFLIALDRPQAQADIENLRVRLVYQGDINQLERAYVAGLWLEVTATALYEDPAEITTDTIEYSRDLLAPMFHRLHRDDLDLSSSRLPSFTMSYTPQQNVLRRAITALVGENQYEVASVKITDQAGQVIDVPIRVDYHDDRTWTLSMPAQPQRFVPGKYTLTINVLENGQTFTDNFEFYWGVLAVNTTKSMYFPGEEVVFNLAALTDTGDTICDANLDLRIIDPTNRVHDLLVQQSGACGENNVTDIPDYFANFFETSELGVYTIQLQHRNRAGEVVHRIQDSFEVRDYIPFVIERTGPTRIFPPAPYRVTLNITAHRSFRGDIIERAPRGFIFPDEGGAEVVTKPEYIELVWRDIELAEGEKLTLSYVFDAPDISPYLYLLGPLDMDGFRELRHWQIASDALGAVAWLTGTQTLSGSNFNLPASPLMFSTSTIDSFYFEHSTSTNPNRLTLKQSGEYLVAVTVPMQRTVSGDSRTRVGVEVRLNGQAVPAGIGRSGFIRNLPTSPAAQRNNESSSHVHFLLTDVAPGDFLEVFVQGLTTDATNVVTVSGQAGVLVEYIPPQAGVFAATTTRTVSSTNLNQATPSALTWTETRQDTGFIHSNSINPENIQISDPGTYLVFVNVPLSSSGNVNRNVLGRVRLDGVTVPGGILSQGYHDAVNQGDTTASIHWSGVVVATTSNQILTVTTELEANTGTTTVPTGFVGSIFIQRLPATDVIALRGRDVTSGTNWNVATPASVRWDVRLAHDTSVFTHSTTTNNHQITVLTPGDYFLTYNAPMFNTTANTNIRIQVLVNGTPVSGAETKAHHISSGNGHNDSSGSLTFLLRGLSAGQIITVTTQQEGVNATLNDRDDAVLLLWRKAALNLRAEVDTSFNVPFDNIRFASTTPSFEFTAVDPDGASDIQYEISISTSSSFLASTTRRSGVDAGFSNLTTPADTSPFIESQRVRFALQSADQLLNNTTYYWRVRARDVSGSNNWSDWSTTRSLTVDLNQPVPSWFQTLDGQFESNLLIGAVSSGNNQVRVDSIAQTEALLVYSEGTIQTPRYRLWDGSAWGAELSAQSVGGTINWSELSAGTTRNEYVLANITANNRVVAQVFNGVTNTWGNVHVQTTAFTVPTTRGLAVVHEQTSGRALVISCLGTDAQYSIWDGTTWSTPVAIPLVKAQNCQFIRAAANPASNEITAVFTHVNTGAIDYEALVWNGSSWANSVTLGESAVNTVEGASVTYNSAGTQAVVTTMSSITTGFAYTVWDGSSWTTPVNEVSGSRPYWFTLTSDPTNPSRIGMCYKNSSAVAGSSIIYAALWTGAAWSNGQVLTTNVSDTGARPVDCRFETVAGRSGNFLVTYSIDTGTFFRVFNGSTWSTQTAAGAIPRTPWVNLTRTGDGVILGAFFKRTVTRDIRTSNFNGTSWAAEAIIETTLTQNVDVPREPFALVAKRFQFNEGQVTTRPIQFNSVPGRPTWGDISFTSTEPLGTDVKIQVLHTNVTTCDTLVPNSALPGNSTGFDITQVPIDISGLSTTTYSQLCLRATITTQGGVSSALDSWELSWQRKPKLNQSSYRWFTNGSFLTPTDPWPPGPNQITENAPITALEAISVNQIARLRMSLQGLNVPLPVGTDAFRLEYAAGLTCTVDMNWSPVGSVGSTTAIWRGAANSVVGDDWLGAGWGRRIKITVDNGQVAEGLTDFPVYVDLSTLPAGFFTAVRGDGGDIRVTRSDGISEVPFELGSINTTLRTGELHFRADLASTTDSEFYIYYNNPSATAYAPTATFGARNVWTNNFDIRYSLNENPDNAAPQFRDSTSNGFDATKRSGAGGLTVTNLVAGRIGSGINHTSANHGATFAQRSYSGPFTASLWWNASGDGFALAGPAGAFEKMGPWNTPANNVLVRTVSSVDSSITHPPDGNWTHVVLTRNSANQVDLYLNGTRHRLYGNVAQIGNSRWENFGGETTQSFRGILDEIRFASVQRSAGWVQTEFNNQNNPVGFYRVSPEERISNGRFLPSTVLSDSNWAETYIEESPTSVNRHVIGVGERAEWDFVLQNNGATPNTVYCFRLVYANGTLLNNYVRFPRLVTNAPPLAPILFKPFDNEMLAPLAPTFEFAANDELSDLVSYQIQVSTDPNFGTVVIDRNSVDNFTLFENISQPAQRSEYTSGQTIRFIPNTNLVNGTTYYWRVRAVDRQGSGAYGAWSTTDSFTVDTATTITTWLQTTAPQFDKNDLDATVTNLSGQDVRIAPSFIRGTTTSTEIDFNDRTTGNAWGQLRFTNNVSSGSIRYHVEFLNSTGQFQLIPNADLSGNSTGFTSSPVSLIGLDTNTYRVLRVVAVLSGNDSLPRLQDWRIEWGQRIEVPTLRQPFDNAKVATTTPVFTFFTTDPEGDAIEYEIQVDSTSAFSAPSTFNSGAHSGFRNTVSPLDTSPFNNTELISYTPSTSFVNGNTYWWRVRARDPLGSGAWSAYSNPYSFTVDTSIQSSVWFQTTGEQFATNQNTDIDTTAGSAQVTSVISGVLAAYGQGTEVAPRYRVWNGNAWSEGESTAIVGAPTRWLALAAAPTRPEYALGVQTTANRISVQIYNQNADTWGNLNTIETTVSNNTYRAFDLAYESLSGRLVAVACSGNDAHFSIWNGSTWSGTTTINLTKVSACQWVKLAANPVSNELMAAFRHDTAGSPDYEVLVWNGSAWGNGFILSDAAVANIEGIALGYNASGTQGMAVLTNTTNNNFNFRVWNGSTWSATQTHATTKRFYWGSLVADPFSGRLALCFITHNTGGANVGVAFWNGTTWDTITTLTNSANDQNGQSVDCQFETTPGRQGYLLVPYSDTTQAQYQVATSTNNFTSQQSVNATARAWRVIADRAGDGTIHTLWFNHLTTPRRYAHTRWNGTSWTSEEFFSTSTSITASPFDGSMALRAQVYPSITSAVMRSNPIRFSDGLGPRWERVTWTDTTPGTSDVIYRLYHETTPGTFVLIPDSALPGNSVGFTNSPLSIAGLNRTIYSNLRVEAELLCVGGDCPSVQDWAVEWSEGITVSGTAYDYNASTTISGGTVAVAVNGILQIGRTATIQANGTFTIANVTAFENDVITVFISGATDVNEAIGVTKYDGIGDVAGMVLARRHLTLGSQDVLTINNAEIGLYDNSDNEDIFFALGSGNLLTLCAELACGDARLRILPTTTYQPGANSTIINFDNFGTFNPATNTLRVASAWRQFGIFNPGESTIIFTATTSTHLLESATTTFTFHNVTFGESSGAATWSIDRPLRVNGNLTINQGSLNRGTTSLAIARNLQLGLNGFISGLGTTTFDGSGSHTWGDAKASTTTSNVGRVVVDGTAKTITLAGNVRAESITIGADDTLNSSGSGFTISVLGNWTNNNLFVPQNGTVDFVGTATGVIARGTSPFNNLTFSGAGGVWSFSTSTLALNGNFTIVTGTVTLPNGTTTIAGSFTNTGTFLHNNGEVRLTSNAPGRTIRQSGTALFNAFNDLVFAGNGSWSYLDTNATTTRNHRIQSGAVTLPAGQLTVGHSYTVTGSGAFAHNNGELVLLVQRPDELRLNGSALNNLRLVGSTAAWYNHNWSFRIPITVQASQIDANLSNFPVYVNLANLAPHFFAQVRPDGGDIRITEGDGSTEVPREVVSLSTSTLTGELHFRATNVSSTTDTTFYIYYGNAGALDHPATSTFGARNVWSNGYVLVSHMNDLTTATVLNSASTTNGAKTSANNPQGVASGYIYNAQDYSGDSIQFTGNIIENLNGYHVSMWFNPDSLTGGNAEEQSFGRTLYGVSPAGSPYEWLRVGGNSFPTELRLCAFEPGTTCNATVGAGLTTGNWHYVSVNAVRSGNTTLRLNGVERLSFTAAGSAAGANFTIGDLRPGRGINFAGRIDEVRVSNVNRSNAWRDAEFRNLASTTSFYAVASTESLGLRSFVDTNATVLGNLVIENGGGATFNSGVLSIGGSFTNNGAFVANNGTVRFNSTTGARTISPGVSPFATVDFNSATGDFTMVGNATATTAVLLTSASQFTVASGVSLATLGGFTNAINPANTTWTGSTLVLAGNNNLTTSAKTYAGDLYGTILTLGTTTARFWNSAANTYVTLASSSIYSQDHAGNDGDLFIFGNYTRVSGVEHWSHNTDFDGAPLSTSSVRQVNVRIASSSVVTISSSTLALLGSATASTTVMAISGSYDLILAGATTTAQHFTFSGMSTAGVRLTASTSLSTFSDGAFTVVPGRTGISIDGATINRNPGAQLFRINFSTTTPGLASNVTLTSSSSNFIWFRQGSGNLYGEAFDAGDDNPGSIRFDDSAISLTVSGTVFADAGVTAMGSSVCDGVTANVRIVVDGGTFASSTSCAAGTGAYSFSNVSFVGDPRVLVFLDMGSTTLRAATFSKTLTTNVSNMDLYAHRLIVRHEDVAPVTIADLAVYDFDNESDLPYLATTSQLTLLPNTELYIWNGKTFTPGGNITLAGNGNSNGHEGTLQLGPNAVFNATGTETHTLAGRLVVGSGATLNTASSTFIFNATTTGKSVTGTSTITFNNLRFNGAGGGWNITANLNIRGELEILSGTVTGNSNITLTNGSVSGNGTLSLGGGTLTLERTNIWGGTTPWTVNNLILGNGTAVGTTTFAGTATTTILGALTVSNAHFLSPGSGVIDLAGSGTVFIRPGTFVEGNSTVVYSGGNANVLNTTYFNLRLAALTAPAVYTAQGPGALVRNDLTIAGATSTTFSLAGNNATYEVLGNVNISSGRTLIASSLSPLLVHGSWINAGTFTSNNGTVRFIGSGTSNITAGASSFGTVEVNNASGTVNLAANATSTGAWRLQNHLLFDAQGQTLAVGGEFVNGRGGALTEWTGSTLSLFGNGTYNINASTTADTYGTLRVASGTQVRMWNSSATTYAVATNGSIYSKDHANQNGDLYIFGNLVRTSGADHWSHATDFDGTNLTGGNERVARVHFASGATATWQGGSLSAWGGVGATTTVQNQGTGTYALTFGTGATVNFNRVQLRDTNTNGVVFAGAPTVVDFSRTDHLVSINSGVAITVGGTAINANEAKNFTNNVFSVAGGVTNPVNVRATGTAVSSWRFTNHTGNLAGEAFDDDPAGDPGYLVWDDSAQVITIAGNVYSDEGITVSPVCDGVTNNIRLVVAGLSQHATSCNPTTGAYSISGITYNTLDSIIVYIDGATPKAANVTFEPVSSISNMHLYHDRVIVRHEGANPINIAKLADWDSSDDADVPFTATLGSPNTLTLPANRKLIVWTGKTFEPNGNVTVSGGGSGDARDGTLEVQTNGRFRANGNESHTIGGSFTFGPGAEFVSASSTITLTSTASGRTVNVNNAAYHNLTISGAGTFTMTDSNLTLNGSYNQSNGAVVLPTGTTTARASFSVTGAGSITAGGTPFVFTAPSGSHTIRFNGGSVGALSIIGGGTFTMTDTHATSTGAVLLTAGSVTLPSGSLSTAGSFEKRSGGLNANGGEIIMRATTTSLLTASSSDLASVRFLGAGPFRITDNNITFLGAFRIASGTVQMASGTTAVGGSFEVTGGSFTHATGTVLMNAPGTGRVVNPGNSTFHNLQFSAPSGGYSLHSATTTNNLIIASVNSLVVQSGATVTVGGVFSNTVGGAATTWTNSTLVLTGTAPYSINSRTNNGDAYGTLLLGANAAVRMWYSSAATTTVATSSSLYSQDHANVNGELNIWGNFRIATTTEFWNYTRDFDGFALTAGNERRVNVRSARNSTTTVLSSGTLQILGAPGNVTAVTNQGTGTYAFRVEGGTLNANHYSFANLNVDGLVLSGLSTIQDLSNGYFDLATTAASLISLSSTTLNANPAKIFDNVGFNATSTLSGFNVNLSGVTPNAWRFTNHYGNISGEAFDVDGADNCGSIRWDNSACLLTEQTRVRWRLDDGGEGAPNSEWFDSNWNHRKRIRVQNNDPQAYATTTVKVTVAYDSAMRADFADLRFTLADGLTLTPHWIERAVASTEATVWVRLPSLPASGQSVLNMYFGNSTATSTSNGSSVFTVFDDFEDGNISEYSGGAGDVARFAVVSSPVYGGTRALGTSNPSGKTVDGIFRFDQTVSQGQIIRYMQYVDTAAGSGDEPCALFGVQSPGTLNQNYAVCLEQFGVDRVSLARNVRNNDVSGTVLATTTVTYTTGWYEVEIDWRTNNTINVSLFNPSGNLVATTSATDTNYTSGGYGFAFWFQHGTWDSFTARSRTNSPPSIFMGARQSPGGASWLGQINEIGLALPGDTLRLRVAIENSGLDISNQLFRLEYAAKGQAPTCESVSSASFVSVPNQATCGMAPVCMQTSTFITDGSVTSDLLSDVRGNFTAGRIITSPSNQTGAFNLNQARYTELEYTLTPTVNASDNYCFRVTNAGTPLDYYGKIAELGLQFNPSFGSVSLNNSLDIALIPGTTTAVAVSSLVTDFNGFADLAFATATIYRSGVGPACSPNANNCFLLSTATNTCQFSNCSGDSCTLTCTAHIPFHADPTDGAGAFAGEEWLAFMEVEDQSGGYAFASALGVELLTLRALTVDDQINFGSLEANQNTGSFNPVTAVINLGNTAINVEIEASDLVNQTAQSVIPATNQKVATSTFTYSACVICQSLSSSTPITLGVQLSKPASVTPPVETNVYWGIAVPFGISPQPHTGVNIFTAVGL